MKKLILRPSDLREKRKALDQFNDLLKSKSIEKDWQSFFDKNPYIFTDTLPIKFDFLYSQVPLISGIPDYVFHKKNVCNHFGDYGVIELKRPDHNILGTYSTKIITSSSILNKAYRQTAQYLNSLTNNHFLNSSDYFCVGNRRYAFIIIGLSKEITAKCKNEILLNQFYNLLPQGFHVITYDELWRSFSNTIEPIIQVLVVKSPKVFTNKILVVDDSIVIRKMVEIAFDDFDYELLLADSGKKGIELFESENPDIILLDIMLGDINGIDILKIVKASKTIPVIMISGKDSQKLIEYSKEYGADAFIAKPFKDDELIKTVEELLAKYY